MHRHVLKGWTARLLAVLTASLVTGLGSAAQAQSAAPAPFSVQWPAGYVGRLAGVEGVLDFGADIDKINAIGVRSFPLPLEQDWRISVVKHTSYWEYVLSTRIKDTTLAAGVINSGEAPAGIAKVEVTHDPYKGVQYSGLLQNYADAPYFSRVSAGYAFTVWQDRIRVLNNVGMAYQDKLVAPYTQTEVSGSYGEGIGPDFNWSLASTARLFTYPTEGNLQASVDVTPSIEYRPVQGLKLNASHLERFADGQVAFSVQNLARYQESNASMTYRFAGDPDFGLGALRVRGTRNWTSDYTYLRNDVFLNFKALPFLIGPSVGYQWGPTAATTQMLYAIVVMGK